MSFTLQLLGVIFSLGIMLVILSILRKGRITVKYSLVWLFSGAGLLFLSIFTSIMNSIVSLIGFEVGSNFIFSGLIAILMMVCITLTVVVSGQTSKIRLLVQEVSMLKEKMDE